MALLDQIRDILNQAHAQGWALTRSTGGTTPDEPGLISQITSDNVDVALNAALRHWPSTSASLVTLSGTFIHQTPMVKTKSGKSELGDLLLVVVNEGTGRGRATFFQAKKNILPETGALTGNEVVQFDLYRHWPTFTISAKHLPAKVMAHPWNVGADVRNGLYLAAFDGEAYKEDPAHPFPTASKDPLRPWKPIAGNDHCRFGPFGYTSNSMDSPTFRVGYVMTRDAATTGVACPDELATYLNALLEETCGREFLLADHQRNKGASFSEWDNLINALIDLGAHDEYTFSHRRTGVGQSGRTSRHRRRRVLLSSKGLPVGASRHVLAFNSVSDLLPQSDFYAAALASDLLDILIEGAPLRLRSAFPELAAIIDGLKSTGAQFPGAFWIDGPDVIRRVLGPGDPDGPDFNPDGEDGEGRGMQLVMMHKYER